MMSDDARELGSTFNRDAVFNRVQISGRLFSVLDQLKFDARLHLPLDSLAKLLSRTHTVALKHAKRYISASTSQFSSKRATNKLTCA